jgi:hypothetical protein
LGAQAGEPHCSFCSKSAEEVRKLIAGPTVFICDVCVDVCVSILAEDVASEAGEAARERFLASKPHEADVHCTLCAAAVEMVDALYFENRAVLCPTCVQSIAQAANAPTPTPDGGIKQ